jgi:hypothetical protein
MTFQDGILCVNQSDVNVYFASGLALFSALKAWVVLKSMRIPIAMRIGSLGLSFIIGLLGKVIHLKRE